MKRYVLSHLPIALVYGLLIMAIRGSWWPFEMMILWRWLGWIGGVVVGVLILFMDRVAYTYAFAGEQLSQQFAWFVKNKKYLQGLAILDLRRQEQVKLTFRSALFITIWIPLAFFSLTSTSGLFGKGVVMGLMLHILFDAWKMNKLNPANLDKRLFWQIRRQFSQEERLVFLTVITGIFVWFSFWVS